MEQLDENIIHLRGQIFSNHLVTQEIWTKLSAKDLLKASLVCKEWCSRSRVYLGRKLCCIQLSENPCIALKEVNRLLENTKIPFYNGIHHDRQFFATVMWPSKYYKPFVCKQDCLLHQPGENLDVREIYSNVFNKLTFKFVGFRGQGNEDCPFMKFIRLVLTEKANEIKEFHFSGLLYPRGTVTLTRHWKISSPENWFPNLVTLKIPKHDMDVSLELIASAPRLKKILGSFDNSSYKEWRDPDRYIPENKRFAITRTTVFGAAQILQLAIDIKPENLEKISLTAIPRKYQDNSSLENSIHCLSNVICHSLKFISCSFSTLALIANVHGVPQFPVLKSMELFNDSGHTGFTQGLYYLKSVNFKRVFPNVEDMRIYHGMCLLPPFMYKAVVDFQSTSVTGLKLDQCHWDCIPIFSCMLPNVTRLQLHSIEDEFLCQLLKASPEWPNLEELGFWSCLEDLQLDHFFRSVPSVVQDGCQENAGSVVHGVSTTQNSCSFFNRKQLKKLSVTGSSACFVANFALRRNVGKYLVSCEVAKSISTMLPGFVIELKVEMNESDHFKPTGVLWKDFNFEHLRTLANISQSSSDSKQGIVCKNSLRIWTIKFS